MPDATHRLGCDIGGTFTDLVLLDEAGGALRVLKVPSTPADPAAAVLQGTETVLGRAGVAAEAVALFIHGTTLAVNTLLQRSGDPVGLLVTRGFRDLLELRRLRLREAQNFFMDKPEALVPRHLVREVGERLLPTGEVYRPLPAGEVEAAADELVRAGCRAIAICFLHAYADGRHEREAAARVRARHPGIYVTASHELWPQRREYERCLVTVINAHMGGRMRGYFERLETGLRALGRWHAPILSMRSNGGVMTARSAGELPVHTLFSGPASGVMGAAWVARQAGWERVITLDMGGTSADVSVVDGGPSYSTEATVGEFPVIMPSIDISSIGAGGGSIARLDAGGLLKVGPQSAGSDPGPACYGRGGVQPTVTDAYLTLGILHPDRFLGGDLRLDPDRAHAALEALGRDLQMDRHRAAWAVLEVATANMYAQLTPLLAKHGVDPREYAFLAYGGAGPTHIFLLLREVGIPRVVVPPLPGALCALGCLVADLRADFVGSMQRESTRLPAAELETAFQALEAQARGWVAREGLPIGRRELVRSAEMRFKGQSFEINVPLPDGPIGDLGPVLAAFQRAYQQHYGYVDPTAPVEVVDLRLQVVGQVPRPAPPPPAAVVPRPLRAPATRRLYLDGGFLEAGVYQRAELRPGDAFAGPAVVEQYDTTTLVPAGFVVRVDAWGNLIGEGDAA
ncbi:MAG: hydantoinase/oxoprolinase family protein [Candidatus Rokubacteria bacterium]|nr:hydantoinase/oxoprolinase family protein [Candidatus Rokubacteria bacterium]